MQQTSQVVFMAMVAVLVCCCCARNLPQQETRIRRATSDQRMAELQALLGLANSNGGQVGHGMVDPERFGKRKRSDSYQMAARAETPRWLTNLLGLYRADDSRDYAGRS